LSHQDVADLVNELADEVQLTFNSDRATPACYAVPRGGVPVAYLLAGRMRMEIVDDPAIADFIVDDVIESGDTRNRFTRVGGIAYGRPFFALVDKPKLPETHPYRGWLQFPWERSVDGSDESVTDNITRLLQHIGEDTKRGGLLETPARVIKAWGEWSAGYGMDPESILKTFEDGVTDEMVVERNIPFFSHCEHHMAPFFGTVSVGYVPGETIVGLSKMNRLVECFARRLQVQERLGAQIADAMMEHLSPKGVGVVIRAQHMCVMSRGIKHAGCDTVTSAVRGCFTERDTRAEFMALVHAV
jgi:GTP cyclohydrolase I